MTRRILYLEANEDGTVGGSHRALVDLVRGLDRTRYEPVVLFYQDNVHVPTLRAAGVEVHVWETERARERRIRSRVGVGKYLDLLTAVVRRRRFLKDQRIALIHVNNSPRVGFDDWLPAARLTGIPCIAFAMGDARITAFIARKMAPRFDHVIAISRFMADAMRRLGIREDRLSLVYLGVDGPALRAAVRQSREATRTELGVPHDGVLAVMVGNIRRWKGQYVVLEALARVPADVRAMLHVRFVGAPTTMDQDYVQELEQRIRDLGLEATVGLIGPRGDVPTLYAAADFALHASVKVEPFGLVVPEAMVHGTPVVASKFGGPGEVLTEECGRTFDPAVPDELATILTTLARDPSLRARLGARAREQVAGFSVDAMVQGVERVYERMFAR